jgi:DNA repair exonuclease SbcCD nuclease subunit
MKFVHSADWQIGMMARGYGVAGERLRRERLCSGERVVAAAAEAGADFILVAGDLFEDNAVDRTLVQKTADVLSGFQGPVFIIPGNHDPLVPGSVWEHPVWRATRNLYVLDVSEPVEIPGGVLYPCPVKEKYARKDPTAWIRAADSQTINIGMAHGSLEGLPVSEPELPIPPDAVERRGLHYLALGHWHSTRIDYKNNGAAACAYSGTPETSGFGERDSGNILMVEIEAPGVAPAVTPVRTGGLNWHVLNRPVRVPGDLSALRRDLDRFEAPADTLLDVRLNGLLFAAEHRELAHIRDLLASRFLFTRLDISQLRPSPDDERWIDGLPPGILKEAAARLRAMAATPGEDSPTAVVAARALMELYALVDEAPQ